MSVKHRREKVKGHGSAFTHPGVSSETTTCARNPLKCDAREYLAVRTDRHLDTKNDVDDDYDRNNDSFIPCGAFSIQLMLGWAEQNILTQKCERHYEHRTSEQLI